MVTTTLFSIFIKETYPFINMESYIFVDSRNGTGTANSYTVHLTHRLRNITRVDLVSAKIPNTMFNVTTGLLNSATISPGFYSAWDLATAIGGQYIPSQGIFTFGAPVTSASPDLQKCLGILNLTQSPTQSQTLIDLSTNDFVFLDIDELKTVATIDSKSLLNNGTDTYRGTTIEKTFGMIPIDVPSGQIKTFKEGTDFRYSIFYKNLDSIDRLTVRWLDLNGNLLNFNGANNNSFILRIRTEGSFTGGDQPELPEVPLIRPEVPVPPHPRRWGRWVVALAILAFLATVYFRRSPSYHP
jgi:hypothetical protein